jgi:rhomboid protease GluP
MLGRQRSGSVVCRSCGRLVGVGDAKCWECGARYPALWGFAPALRRLGEDLGFTWVAIGACVLLYAVSLALDPTAIRAQGFLNFLAPSVPSGFLLGSAGKVPVLGYGRWWTVLSAGWLHGSLLHIFFNMYWVRLLAPGVARLYGPGRMMIVYSVASVVGFAMSSVVPTLLQAVLPRVLAGPVLFVMGDAGFTLGASAALMGLLGALVYYGRRGGSSEVGRWAWGYAILFFVFGIVVRAADNWAHLGGFLGGYLVARMLDPLKPERIDHLVIGLVLLVLSALAIVASVVTGLPIVRS